MAYKKEYENIYENAVQERSWFSLIPYPYLLFRWQTQNTKDIKPIAKLASHRNGKHKWCGDECEKIDNFIRKYELGQKSFEAIDGEG